MSTSAAASGPNRQPALHVVGVHRAGGKPAPRHGAADPGQRLPLARLCAGEPILLADDEVDLLGLLNAAHDVHPRLLGSVDPDDHHLAELLLERFLHRYGIQRHANGARVTSVASAYKRHLLPFLVELGLTRPERDRGVAHLRIGHLEPLPQVLAGDRPMPAATVAGDLLGRRGITCVYLSLTDAATVSEGGESALHLLLAEGELATFADVRTGEPLVRAMDLRAAGLLTDRTHPHGLAISTARNVLRDLRHAIERARDQGARVRGTFRLEAIEPLADRRLREPKPAPGYTSLRAIAETNVHMRIIGQVVLWIARLVGERISEVYGLLVCDFYRDPLGRGWLHIDKQGGKSNMVRDPATGRFERQDRKDGTKTPAGTRDVPIPAPLATLLDRLVSIFHTDTETGEVDLGARLIPGVQSENVSGQSAFRGWLDQAQRVTGVSFDPHHLRGALITDLKNAGISPRVAHYYAGHEQPNPTIQDEHYDRGPTAELLFEVTDVLEAKIREELNTGDLWVPTALRETWGRGTRHYRQRAAIEELLVACGWRAPHESAPGLGRLLDTASVATRIDKSPQHARRLMAAGVIAAHTRKPKAREVWMAWEVDVRAYLERTGGMTVQQLADEMGWSYHQTWHQLRQLELLPEDRGPGSALRLASASVERFRVAVGEDARLRQGAMPVREAAAELDLDVTTVETLIRQGHLDLVEDPAGRRGRWVSRISVAAYNAACPPVDLACPVGEDAAEQLLTVTETKRLLGLTRPQLTREIATRQLQTGRKPGSRHQYVALPSAVAWARRRGLHAAEAAVIRHAQRQ